MRARFHTASSHKILCPLTRWAFYARSEILEAVQTPITFWQSQANCSTEILLIIPIGQG